MNDLTGIAAYLAQRFYDCEDLFRDAGNKVTKRYDLAAANLDGACAAVHAMGIGRTPHQIRTAIMDVCRAAGPRPMGGSHPTDRNRHMAGVSEALAAALSALD